MLSKNALTTRMINSQTLLSPLTTTLMTSRQTQRMDTIRANLNIVPKSTSPLNKRSSATRKTTRSVAADSNSTLKVAIPSSPSRSLQLTRLNRCTFLSLLLAVRGVLTAEEEATKVKTLDQRNLKAVLETRMLFIVHTNNLSKLHLASNTRKPSEREAVIPPIANLIY